MDRFNIDELDLLLEFEDVYVVDVLDTMYHQCGTRCTEIRLMSDGSVCGVEVEIPQSQQNNWQNDCLF